MIVRGVLVIHEGGGGDAVWFEIEDGEYGEVGNNIGGIGGGAPPVWGVSVEEALL